MATAESPALPTPEREPGAALVSPALPAEAASPAPVTAQTAARFPAALPPLAEVSAMLLEATIVLARLLGAEFAVVAYTVGAEESARLWVRRVEPAGAPCEKPAVEYRCGLEDSMFGHALRMYNAVISPNLQTEKRFQDAALRQQGLVSGLLFPVHRAGEAFAAVGVGRRQPHDFTLSDLCFVEKYLQPLGRLVEQVEARCQGPAAGEHRLPSNGQTSAQQSGPEEDVAAMADAANQLSQEGRVSPRHDFPYRQQIAPLSDATRPTWGDFFEVRCSDISAGGISILCDEPPWFNDLVVALGRPPSVTHLAAKVVHVREEVRDARVIYQVGCRFVGRYYL